MEDLLKVYKDMAFDPKQPFALRVYHLHKQFPNDKDFGENVRKLLVKMENYIREKNAEKNKEDLDKIIKDGKL
jgi:hypothetical protein